MVQLPLADLEAPATDQDDLPLVVLVRVIRSHDDPSHARLESAQAGVLASVWSTYVRLVVLANWAKLVISQPPPPRRVAQDEDRSRSLDSVPTVSHAKCRSCGQVRHKIARWNLCQACWEEIRPEVRAEWRRIKDRRRLRRAVDDEVRRRQQQRQRDIQAAAERARQEEQREEEPTPMTTPTEMESLAERNGHGPVPPIGTPERAMYMRSFLDVPPPLTPEAVANVLDLYETDITTADLRDLFGIAQGTLQSLLTTHGVTTRADRTTPRATGEGHVEISAQGRFVWVGGQRRQETPKQLRMRVEALFGRHLLRAYPQALEGKTKEEEEEVEPTPVEEPVASATETESHMEQSAASEARQRLQVQRIVAPPPALVPVPQLAPRRTRHKLSATQADEIVKLYQESDASVQEIVDAYSCSNGQLYRLLEARGLPLRGRDWSPPVRPHPEAQPAPAQEITHEEPAVPQPVELVRAWQEPEPAPNGQTEEPQPQSQPVQPIFVARRTDQLWSITYIVHRSQIVNAPDLDAALATVRHNMGHDIDIISVVRG